MKTLKQTTRALKNALLAKSNIFANAQLRHSALAAFANLATFVNALPFLNLPAETQHAITKALLAEYAQGDQSFWSSVLIVAYEPLLGAIEWEMREGSQEERVQTLIVYFLEAARAASKATASTNAPGYLRTALNNILGRGEKHARLAPACVPYDEDATAPDPNAVFSEPTILKVIAIPGGKELLDAIASGAKDRHKLAAFLRKAHPAMSAKSMRALISAFEHSPAAFVKHVRDLAKLDEGARE